VNIDGIELKSPRGLAHSKTLRARQTQWYARQRPGVRQSSGAFASTLLVIFLSLFLWLLVSAQTDPSSKQRQRRIIFNNDGNEPVYLCKTATKEELLRSRTTPLIGTQVDSIFYCTWSSGFGMFTHFTKVGQIFTTREGRFTNNCMPEFIEKRIDPLQVLVEFAHSNRMELFWSFRMNDTHDGSPTDYGPIMFRANKLKQAHPEWLIGSINKRPKYGVWSAVDFGVPEIRDLAFRYCEEVCQNYDVDGIELDFFRHAFFFKSSARGEPCTEAELSQMTDLIRRIRKMTQDLGRKRNRPILLAVRVPDSLEYCRFIGLDLENWLKGNLLDLLVVAGYTQLNPWAYSVNLGHKYGVQVYPSLDESRIKNDPARELRAGLATYRGRALNVWSAGADGVYMFNYFDAQSSLWRELGDPKVLAKLKRNYFASIRGVGSVPVPHQKFINVSTLNSTKPSVISPGHSTRIEFVHGEKAVHEASRSAMLRLQFDNLDISKDLTLTLDGKTLPSGKINDGWIDYKLTNQLSTSGNCLLEIKRPASQKGKLSLLDLYVAVSPR
jgi:hypothetical protein